jgi:preprotein translocase subunit SecY
MINVVCFFCFLILAIIHLYFSLVQRAIAQIGRAGDLAVLTAANLTPSYFILAWPFTIIKWILLIYWVYAGSAVLGLLLFAFFYLANAVAPIPARLTLKPIKKQIELVRVKDSDLATVLEDATNIWEMRGRRF